MNNKGECEIYSLEKCTVDYFANYSLTYLRECQTKCRMENFPSIYIKLNGDSLDLNEESYKNLSILNDSQTIDDIGTQIYYNRLVFTEESKNLITNIPMCSNK